MTLLTRIETAKWRSNSAGVVDSAASEGAINGHGPHEGSHDIAEAECNHFLRGVQHSAACCRAVSCRTINKQECKVNFNFLNLFCSY